MTTPLPDPNKPNLILPGPPQDDRDIWEIEAELPPLPYLDEDDLGERLRR